MLANPLFVYWPLPHNLPMSEQSAKKITCMPQNAFLGGVPKKGVGTLPNPELFQDIQIFTTCHKIVTKLCAPEKNSFGHFMTFSIEDS